MLAFAAFRQPWWQAPQFAQACRSPQCGWSRSAVSTAAGASVARRPSVAQARIIASAAPLRPAGGSA
jgi:hypothetical protein